ncbi:hypothetical protein MINTM005_13310 [Mycobacterium intracellulare]|uniref:hypothetical protein n=1 Tax=Mycobacterium intracellulare TaxID=1767 RepID=UPI0019274B3A|nr:hypothetical protein [Mycobacterium intracellulare]BCO56087.1 hypothetical protein MINTM005_13310 [Mycobacterium intracellulare]
MAARKASEELTLFEKLQREVKVPAPLKVTEDIILECPSKAQLEASKVAETEDESNKILLGDDNFNKLNELFGPEAPHLWAEFNRVYLEHFFAVPRAQ